FASALGRTVLAVPGDLDRPTSRGTLGLLRAGARVCGDAGDVLAALGSAPAGPTDPAARLRAQLSAEPATVQALAAACGLDVPETLGRLLRMQWSGLAIQHPGARWSSRPSGPDAGR